MFTRLAVVATLAASGFASPFITSPVASTTCTGNSACNVTWQDSGDAPTLSTFGDAIVSLCVGSTFEQSEMQRVVSSVDVSKTSTISFTVDPNAGEDSGNYFIRMTSISGKNGSSPYTVYSSMFQLTGMTGTFNSTVKAQIAAEESQVSLLSVASTATGAIKTSALNAATGSAAASAASSQASTSSAGRLEIASGFMGLSGAVAAAFLAL